MGPASISAVIIALNSEKDIDRCLASLRGAVDEIIVVDTGSIDKTAEIAKFHGARVMNFSWIDDFSAARNFGIDHASGVWIMIIDTDEELSAEMRAALPKLTSSDESTSPGFSGFNVYSFKVVDHYAGELTESLRLFKKSTGIRYRGRIHEYLDLSQWRSEDPIGNYVAHSELRIIHYGYDPDGDDKLKRSRNLSMLKKELETYPNDEYLHFYLGMELSAAGKQAEAIKELELTTRHFDPQIASSSFRELALIHEKLGIHDEAIATAKRGLSRFPDYRDLYFVIAHNYQTLKRYDLAIKNFLKCLSSSHIPAKYRTIEGIGGNLSYQNLGYCFSKLGRVNEAIDSFTRALKLKPDDDYSLNFLVSLLKTSLNDAGIISYLKEYAGFTDEMIRRITDGNDE